MIVICHHPDNKEFLDDLIASLGDLPYDVCTDGIQRPKDSFEPGAIEYAARKYEHFILLQDTCLVKDIQKLKDMLNTTGNIAFTDKFYHYIGKYQSDRIRIIPVVNSKDETIKLESRWQNHLSFSYPDDPLPIHTDVFEEKYGARRMKLENSFIIKWKKTFYI